MKTLNVELYNNLCIVIVIYNNKIEDSVTYKSLTTALDNNLCFNITLIIYDNSPIAQIISDDENTRYEMTYIHDSANPGLSKAYNKGLEIAKNKNIRWLLLLDQDTVLPENYLDAFLKVDFKNLPADVVCLVPKVLAVGREKIIAPIRIYYGALFVSFKKIKPGILSSKITGINSGTFLSVNFIDELGGFDNRFPLDMLDHWYFSEIAKAKKRVFLLDAIIYHNLSVNRFESEVSLLRYTGILRSEKLFSKKNIFTYLIFKLRLVKRLLQQASYREKGFFYITLRNLI
jgi:GT2 family glycosyltransferase